MGLYGFRMSSSRHLMNVKVDELTFERVSNRRNSAKESKGLQEKELHPKLRKTNDGYFCIREIMKNA